MIAGHLLTCPWWHHNLLLLIFEFYFRRYKPGVGAFKYVNMPQRAFIRHLTAPHCHMPAM